MLSSAFSVNCGNPNILYPSNIFHRNSELMCIVESTTNCSGLLANYQNISLEKELVEYPEYNNSVIIYKDLSKYPIIYQNNLLTDTYYLDIRCGINTSRFVFTTTIIDRLCYDVPYMNIKLCTPILDDYAYLIRFLTARLDIIIVTPIMGIVLGVIYVFILIAYNRILNP